MTNNGMELSWRWYLKYLKEWADGHNGMEFFGQSPACYQEWFDNEMAEQEGGDDVVVDPDIGMEV